MQAAVHPLGPTRDTPGRSRVRRLHADGPARVEHTHPHQEWVPHWHTEWSFGAAMQGGCHCSIGGQTVDIRPGDLVVIPPQVVHTGAVQGSASAGPMHMVMLYATPAWLDQRGLHPPHHGGVLSAPDLTVRATGLTTGDDVAAWLRDALACWQAGHRVHARLVTSTAVGGDEHQLLAQVQQAVMDGTATVAALAARCGVSRKWMHLQMTRWTGMSPSDYLRTARLHRARALLDSGMAPSQVAAECAFADQAHFTRWFRRAFGYTPGDWVAAADAAPHETASPKAAPHQTALHQAAA